MQQKYSTALLKTNYPVSFHRDGAHMDGAILLASS